MRSLFRSRQRWVLLPLLCLAVWASNLDSPWLRDDLPTIVNNPTLCCWSKVPSFWLRTVSENTNQEIRSEVYRPLTHFSFFLDRKIYGGHAWGFHLTNKVLHLTVAL